MSMYVNRTMILPAIHAPLARALAAHLSGPPGEGMWITGLSPTGSEPATRYVSSGPVGAEFDAMLTDPVALWGAVQMATNTGMQRPSGAPELTQTECTALVESAEVVGLDDEPVFDTFARLGLVMVESE